MEVSELAGLLCSGSIHLCITNVLHTEDTVKINQRCCCESRSVLELGSTEHFFWGHGCCKVTACGEGSWGEIEAGRFIVSTSTEKQPGA